MDYRPRRLRTGLLLGSALLAGVAVAPAFDLVARCLVPVLGMSGAFAQDSGHVNTYRLLGLFGDVFERVRDEYVNSISDKNLIENAIQGMLTGLDPHSAYISAVAFQEMQVQTTGQFGGIGVEVTPENGLLRIVTSMDDTPASRAGIKAGDIITRLNGTSVQGLSLENLRDQMRGPLNSVITSTIEREGRQGASTGSINAARGHPHPGGEAEDGAGQRRLCATDGV